jgi:hypothetical protein
MAVALPVPTVLLLLLLDASVLAQWDSRTGL